MVMISPQMVQNLDCEWYLSIESMLGKKEKKWLFTISGRHLPTFFNLSLICISIFSFQGVIWVTSWLLTKLVSSQLYNSYWLTKPIIFLLKEVLRSYLGLWFVNMSYFCPDLFCLGWKIMDFCLKKTERE